MNEVEINFSFESSRGEVPNARYIVRARECLPIKGDQCMLISFEISRGKVPNARYIVRAQLLLRIPIKGDRCMHANCESGGFRRLRSPFSRRINYAITVLLLKWGVKHTKIHFKGNF